MLLERPLKEWEIVTDVITSWDIQTTKNALIMKTYNYYESLLASVNIYNLYNLYI